MGNVREINRRRGEVGQRKEKVGRDRGGRKKEKEEKEGWRNEVAVLQG